MDIRFRLGTSTRTTLRPLARPRVYIAGGLFIALVMLALVSTVLYQGREDALERARETSRNVALIAERDIERNFELYDLSLQAVAEGLDEPDVMALPPHLRRKVLFDRASTAKYLGSMLVVDASGNIVLDSAGDMPRTDNLADRKYFTIQRDNPNAGLYVSDPFQSRLRPGARCIALSRRLSRADGSFAGIVVVTIEIEYFHRLFAGLSLGPHGAISLIGRDGAMFMRQPYDPRVIGRDISDASTFRHFISVPEGSYSDISSIDGTRRLYYFRNFPDLPLIIMVAEAEPDIYAVWRHRALMIGSLTTALALAFVGAACLLAAQLQHRMQLEAELEALATTDGLTGMANRRTLDGILAKEWQRARRTRTPLSLLFIDVDHFKAYNDTYGHQCGDDALAAIAGVILACIRRPTDLAGRYGGEEFLVVLPETTAAGAGRVAEEICRAISDLAIEHAGSDFGHITASIGTTSSTPAREGDVARAVRLADEALYQAKAAGRNRVWPVPSHVIDLARARDRARNRAAS